MRQSHPPRQAPGAYSLSRAIKLVVLGGVSASLGLAGYFAGYQTAAVQYQREHPAGLEQRAAQALAAVSTAPVPQSLEGRVTGEIRTAETVVIYVQKILMPIQERGKPAEQVVGVLIGVQDEGQPGKNMVFPYLFGPYTAQQLMFVDSIPPGTRIKVRYVSSPGNPSIEGMPAAVPEVVRPARSLPSKL